MKEKLARRELFILALGLGLESCIGSKPNSTTQELTISSTPDPQDIESAVKSFHDQLLSQNYEYVKNNESNQNAPSIDLCLEWPVYGPVSSFFTDFHPFGIDIDKFKNPKDIIKAPLDGKVVFSGGDPKKEYGNFIVLEHENGIFTLYAHLSKIGVEEGKKIKTGAEIGIVGKTGNATGPHLHFEIRTLRTMDNLSLLSYHLKYPELWDDPQNQSFFYFYNPLTYLNSTPGQGCNPYKARD